MLGTEADLLAKYSVPNFGVILLSYLVLGGLCNIGNYIIRSGGFCQCIYQKSTRTKGAVFSPLIEIKTIYKKGEVWQVCFLAKSI